MDKEALQKLMSMGGKLPNPGAAGGPLVKLVGVTAGLGLGMYGLYNSLFTVENGQRAIIFNKFGKDRNSTLPIPDKGIDQMTVLTEGTHIAIPWFQVSAQPLRRCSCGDSCCHWPSAISRDCVHRRSLADLSCHFASPETDHLQHQDAAVDS